jgi:2-enoate reductase
MPRIDRHRTKYSAWKALADGCHSYGARLFIQLTPGLGRVGPPECVIKKHRLPISASWNWNFYVPDIPCRPILNFECRKLIRNAGQDTADAKELGIDGLDLHGHEGYLLGQMTDPAFNRRKLGKYAIGRSSG